MIEKKKLPSLFFFFPVYWKNEKWKKIYYMTEYLTEHEKTKKKEKNEH